MWFWLMCLLKCVPLFAVSTFCFTVQFSWRATNKNTSCLTWMSLNYVQYISISDNIQHCTVLFYSSRQHTLFLCCYFLKLCLHNTRRPYSHNDRKSTLFKDNNQGNRRVARTKLKFTRTYFGTTHKFQQLTKVASFENSHSFTQLSTLLSRLRLSRFRQVR